MDFNEDEARKKAEGYWPPIQNRHELIDVGFAWEAMIAMAKWQHKKTLEGIKEKYPLEGTTESPSQVSTLVCSWFYPPGSNEIGPLLDDDANYNRNLALLESLEGERTRLTIEVLNDTNREPPSQASNVDQLIEGMFKTIEQAAREYVRDWPLDTYVRNDLPAFFEQGAMWAIRSMAPRLTLTAAESPSQTSTIDELNLEPIIKYFRTNAVSSRETFPKTNPPGGTNGPLYDKWADRIEALRDVAMRLTLTAESENTKLSECLVPGCGSAGICNLHQKIKDLEQERISLEANNEANLSKLIRAEDRIDELRRLLKLGTLLGYEADHMPTAYWDWQELVGSKLPASRVESESTKSLDELWKRENELLPQMQQMADQPFTMSQYVSKNDLHEAMRMRIAELTQKNAESEARIAQIDERNSGLIERMIELDIRNVRLQELVNLATPAAEARASQGAEWAKEWLAKLEAL